MRLPILKKDLRDIVREKTFISTVLLQIFMVGFYTVAIFGIIVIFNPGGSSSSEIPLKIIYENEYPSDLVGLVRQNRDFELREVKEFNPENIQDEISGEEVVWIYKRDLDFDYDFVRIFIDSGDFEASFHMSESKKILEEYEVLKRQERTDLRDYPVTEVLGGRDPDDFTIRRLIFEFTYLIMIPILFFLPIYLSGTLLIDNTTEEFKKKTIGVLLSTPFSLSNIMLQKTAAALLLSVIQIGAWILVITSRGIDINYPSQLFMILVLINITMLLVAALVSVYFRERVNAQTIFSLLFIIIIVTKGYVFNPLNVIIKLSIHELPGIFIFGYLAFWAALISILLGLLILTLKKMKKSCIDNT
jgi:hypothetical protein